MSIKSSLHVVPKYSDCCTAWMWGQSIPQWHFKQCSTSGEQHDINVDSLLLLFIVFALCFFVMQFSHICLMIIFHSAVASRCWINTVSAHHHVLINGWNDKTFLNLGACGILSAFYFNCWTMTFLNSCSNSAADSDWSWHSCRSAERIWKSLTSLCFDGKIKHWKYSIRRILDYFSAAVF